MKYAGLTATALILLEGAVDSLAPAPRDDELVLISVAWLERDRPAIARTVLLKTQEGYLEFVLPRLAVGNKELAEAVVKLVEVYGANFAELLVPKEQT